MTEALLGLIATLVAALVWVVKKTSRTNSDLIQSLIKAVQAFEHFEENETMVHREIVQTQRSLVEGMNRILLILDRIDQRTLECRTNHNSK